MTDNPDKKEKLKPRRTGQRQKIRRDKYAIAREIGDRSGEGNALGNLGLAYRSLGDYRRAIDFHEQHLAIAREIGDPEGEGNALSNLGTTYYSLGDYRSAIDFQNQSLAIAREIGDRSGEGTALYNLSLSLYQISRRVEATAEAEAALKVLEEIELPFADMVRRKLAEWRDQT